MKRSQLKNLIKKLGGPTVVSKSLGCDLTSQAVCKWDRVPVRHCVAIETLARERMVVRSDGTPYTRAVFQPDMNWGSVPDKFTRVEA